MLRKRLSGVVSCAFGCFRPRKLSAVRLPQRRGWPSVVTEHQNVSFGACAQSAHEQAQCQPFYPRTRGKTTSTLLRWRTNGECAPSPQDFLHGSQTRLTTLPLGEITLTDFAWGFASRKTAFAPGAAGRAIARLQTQPMRRGGKLGFSLTPRPSRCALRTSRPRRFSRSRPCPTRASFSRRRAWRSRLCGGRARPRNRVWWLLRWTRKLCARWLRWRFSLSILRPSRARSFSSCDKHDTTRGCMSRENYRIILER